MVLFPQFVATKEATPMMRKLLLGATASILCAPFALAQDENNMAADLNAQQLESFRASVNENYIGEGDIDTGINEGGDTTARTETVDPHTVDATVTEDSTMGPVDIESGARFDENAGDSVEDAADDTAEAIDEQADDAEDAARDAADNLRDSADEAGDDLSSEAEESVEEAADDAADQIEENAEAAEEAADEAAEDVEDSADAIRDDITDDDDTLATPPYDKPDEADAIKDPSDPN